MRYKQDHHNFNFISFNYTDSLERCLSVFADGIIARRRINGSEYLNKIGTIVHIHGTKTNLPKQKERLEKRYKDFRRKYQKIVVVGEDDPRPIREQIIDIFGEGPIPHFGNPELRKKK